MNNNKSGISPTVFCDFFYAELRARKEKSNKLLNKYEFNKEWTNEIKNVITTFCKRDLELPSVELEHWPKLDLSFFDKCCDDEWDEWALEIAVEVENTFNSCTQEIRKLLLINAGLKVLITYYKSKESVDDLMIRFQDIYDSRQYHTNNEKWLLLFGPPLIDGKWENWISYKLENHKISKIREDDIFN